MAADGHTKKSPARWPATFAVLWAATVAYGSLVPFNYERLGFGDAVARFREIPFLQLGVSQRADWVANGLLFVPIGLFGTATLCPRGGPRATCVLSSVFCAAAVVVFAALLEFAQLWFPGRTVSQNDILAEAVGGAAGAALWPPLGPRLTAWVEGFARRTAGGDFLRLGLSAYVVGLFLYSVMPLDVVLSADELERKWQDGKIDLELRPAAFDPTRGEFWAYVAAFAPLGLFAGVRVRAGRFRALGAGLVILAALEVAQLFVFSRHVNLSHTLTAAAGVAVGVFAAGRFPEATSAAVRFLRDDRRHRRRLWATVAVAYAGLLAFVLWRPLAAALSTPGEAVAEYLAVPFSRLYRGTEFNALQQVLTKIGLFLPFGFAATQAAGADPRRRAIAVALVATFCVATEVGQGMLTARVCDVTDSLLYAAGASLGAFAAARLRAGTSAPAAAEISRAVPGAGSLQWDLPRRAIRRPVAVAAAGAALTLTLVLAAAAWRGGSGADVAPASFDPRAGTRFTDRPLAPFTPPRVEPVDMPTIPGAESIGGAVGRDRRGRIWLGVSVADRPGASARLLAYDPASGRVTDHGDALGQLRRAGLLRGGERQALIRAKIVADSDGNLYFASADGARDAATADGSSGWGSHLWRYRPPDSDWGRFTSRWEHLASVSEPLVSLAGGGRSLYAVGAGQVLYRFDTASGRLDSITVASARGRAAPEVLADHRGHVYFLRLEPLSATLSADRGQPVSEELVLATLVELDGGLLEVAETPLTETVATEPSHGISGFAALADGAILFLTSAGGLYRIEPSEEGPASVGRLGRFHPDGPVEAASLFTYSGRWHAVGTAERPGGGYDWVTYDLERRRSIALPLAVPEGIRGACVGCLTRDDAGTFYVTARRTSGRRSEPVLLRLVPEI